MNKIAAFFDVDHTILAKASGTLYVKYLHQIGLTNRWHILLFMGQKNRNRIHISSWRPEP